MSNQSATCAAVEEKHEKEAKDLLQLYIVGFIFTKHYSLTRNLTVKYLIY